MADGNLVYYDNDIYDVLRAADLMAEIGIFGECLEVISYNDPAEVAALSVDILKIANEILALNPRIKDALGIDKAIRVWMDPKEQDGQLWWEFTPREV